MPTIERLPRTKYGNPRMRLTDDIYAYWCERLRFKSSELDNERVAKNSLSYHGDTLYHYGSHFPLAEIVRKPNGAARLVLLNGDSYGGAGGWGPSTSARQREIRREVETAIAGTDIETIILPFSVFSEAGIKSHTIQPLEVRPDRTTTEHHSAANTPATRPAKLAKMQEPSGATYDHVERKSAWVHKETGEPFDPWATGSYQSVNSETHEWREYDHHEERPVYIDNPERTIPFSSGHGYCHDGATLGDDGRWHWTTERHWLGDSLFKAKLTETRTRPATAEEIAARDLWNENRHQREQANDAVGKLTRERDWATSGRHEYDRERREYVQIEPPNPERAAELEVEIEAARNRLQALYAAEPPYPRTTNAASSRVSYQVTRWAKFLSSFDYQEPGGLYFMCELPHRCKATTVDEAIEALKPPQVVAALAAGLEVLRQGDVFAIPTAYTTDDLKAKAKPFERSVYTQFGEPGDADYRWEHVPHTQLIASKAKDDKEARVLKTNHAGTHVIHAKNGDTFARGRLYHTPTESWRTPDHRVVKLGDGDTWYRLVRNTVPETHSGGLRSFSPRAWTIRGSVD